MSPDDYQLLYDIALHRAPNLLWLPLCGTVLAVALVLAWRRKRRGQSIGMPGFVSIGLALFLGVVLLSIWDHYRLVDALQGGKVQVVEGLVQSHSVQHRAVYNPQSKRHDRSIAESFYVGEVPFGFIRDGSAAGFTNAGADPLVLGDGQQLRLHYVEDTPGAFDSRRILRVERRLVRTASQIDPTLPAPR